MKHYVVATIKEWNIENYKKNLPRLQSENTSWHLLSSKEELNIRFLDKIKPEYIFFPHWSWIVPKEITENYSCVCFHMTDVPYGRGGSPLQNLIIRGHKKTKLTALRMAEELDAGPVYLKTDLDLSGTAEEIFKRASTTVFELIEKISRENPRPIEQTGEVTSFERRKPKDSDLGSANFENTSQVYDFIRMLDAPTYPKAFLNINGYRIIFDKAELSEDNGGLTANVRITPYE